MCCIWKLLILICTPLKNKYVQHTKPYWSAIYTVLTQQQILLTHRTTLI